jgi:hypothetical protein
MVNVILEWQFHLWCRNRRQVHVFVSHRSYRDQRIQSEKYAQILPSKIPSISQEPRTLHDEARKTSGATTLASSSSCRCLPNSEAAPEPVLMPCGVVYGTELPRAGWTPRKASTLGRAGKSRCLDKTSRHTSSIVGSPDYRFAASTADTFQIPLAYHVLATPAMPPV